MKTRIISGVVMGIILVAALLMGGYVLGGIGLIVSEIGYYELTRALSVNDKSDKISALTVTGMVMVFIHYLIIIYFKTTGGFLSTLLIAFIAIMSVYVLTFPRFKAEQAISAVFAFVYCPFMLSFLLLIRNGEMGRYYVWVPFVAWISDTFAYFTGRALGKHKMTPVLSPNKTIEGAVGGVVFSMIAGVIFGLLMVKIAGGSYDAIPQYVIITFAASLISQIGDLAASAIKRDRNIKDYGSLIPGHGGIMDRFDSVIFVTPFVYILFDILM
ncbi:phosphatidate cytidylyltransferase [Butyrivibrio sp. MC2013]|uniref:phosphatidate cytidylyltransferase n=1 Tax=Butyrivibrio sp. MC2013 TaxID=1280686 RepID=UPI00047CC11C|nr:phosphatidate cytidylyltransferase [Butyrivibrio sp. MC2013]